MKYVGKKLFGWKLSYEIRFRFKNIRIILINETLFSNLYADTMDWDVMWVDSICTSEFLAKMSHH